MLNPQLQEAVFIETPVAEAQQGPGVNVCERSLQAKTPDRQVDPQVIELFTQCGALMEGHFKLSSGLHSAGYLQCALVLQHPVHAATLGSALADRIRSLGPAVVASPALGGIIIGHEVARALQVRAVFGERKDGRLTLRRGFRLAPADRVIVVEDVLTTGGSTIETADVAALTSWLDWGFEQIRS